MNAGYITNVALVKYQPSIENNQGREQNSSQSDDSVYDTN